MSLAGFRVDCSVLVGARGVTFLINGISLSTRLSRQVARACTRTGVASVQELWRRPRREGTGAAVAAMCMARCLGGAQRLSSVRSVNDTLSRISEELATCISGAPARALPAIQSSGDARAESEVRIAARTFLPCVRSMSLLHHSRTDGCTKNLSFRAARSRIDG